MTIRGRFGDAFYGWRRYSPSYRETNFTSVYRARYLFVRHKIVSNEGLGAQRRFFELGGEDAGRTISVVMQCGATSRCPEKRRRAVTDDRNGSGWEGGRGPEATSGADEACGGCYRGELRCERNDCIQRAPGRSAAAGCGASTRNRRAVS